MALINCEECRHKISDSAMSCPNCGHPSPRAVKLKKTASFIKIGAVITLLSIPALVYLFNKLF